MKKSKNIGQLAQKLNITKSGKEQKRLLKSENLQNTSQYFSPKKDKKNTDIQCHINSNKSQDTKEFSKTHNSTMLNNQENWEPLNWKTTLDNIQIMRKNNPAPVDNMGCDKCSDKEADEKTKRFQILVALMLSSQTKDQVTYDAMNRLKSKNLNPSTLNSMDIVDIEDILKPVGFYKNKAKYLKKTAKILIEEYNSDIPNKLEELIKLPGVGPKMAHICMSSAWNIISGIGVDVHVHRISNRLGWVQKQTKEPENTRKELEKWLPKEYWAEVNHLLVGFGQTICTPIKPKCDICLNKDICPSFTVGNSKGRKKRLPL